MCEFSETISSKNSWRILAPLIFLVLLSFGSVGFLWQETSPPSTSPCRQAKKDALLPQNQAGEVTIISPQQRSFEKSVETDFSSEPLTKRVGFGLSTQVDPFTWGKRISAGWYLDWDIQFRRYSQYPIHWQMVRLSSNCITPSLNFLRWMALHFPGQVWIIGNEPDVLWQDSLTPEEYARLYHDTYQAIKSSDPSAIVAAAGISQASPLRLAYLDRVLAVYKSSYNASMPVDWWTVHGYVLREERGSWGVDIPPGFSVKHGELYQISDHGRLDLFKQQLIIFRKWMAKNGYRNTPLALTEFGILMPPDYGFSTQAVQTYLKDTFDWLSSAVDADIGLSRDGNRLVQRWAWFSLADSIYPGANLADLQQDRLTPIGETFQKFMLDHSQ